MKRKFFIYHAGISNLFKIAIHILIDQQTPEASDPLRYILHVLKTFQTVANLLEVMGYGKTHHSFYGSQKSIACRQYRFLFQISSIINVRIRKTHFGRS
ncbi:MAG: hypothetical protein ABIN89_29880 [Chitinophagaceae bacterium]